MKNSMTRKEEIELAWLNKVVQSNHKYDEKSFKEAVEWADKTMIERVEQWLIKNNRGQTIGSLHRFLEEE